MYHSNIQNCGNCQQVNWTETESNLKVHSSGFVEAHLALGPYKFTNKTKIDGAVRLVDKNSKLISLEMNVLGFRPYYDRCHKSGLKTGIFVQNV